MVTSVRPCVREWDTCNDGHRGGTTGFDSVAVYKESWMVSEVVAVPEQLMLQYPYDPRIRATTPRQAERDAKDLGA